MSSVYILDTCSQPPLSTRHSSRREVVMVAGEAALDTSVEMVEDTLETVETVEVEKGVDTVEGEGQSSSSLPSLQSCWPSHRWTNQRRLLRSRDQSLHQSQLTWSRPRHWRPSAQRNSPTPQSTRSPAHTASDWGEGTLGFK